MSLARIVVVGGHGKVALQFARLASSKYTVTSLVRSESHFDDITATGASPKLVSLEHASVEQLAHEFQHADGILFAAGAGGKGPKERTVAVDQEGAIKVFDAIESLGHTQNKPKLVLVGAIDTRDTSKPPPQHYTEHDIEESQKVHKAIGAYYDAKLAATENLYKRNASFPWIELRPGHLTDDAAAHKIALGVTGLGSISREDVAHVLLALFDLPRDSFKHGVSLDLIQGHHSIEQAVERAVKSGESSFSLSA
ncbi:uncharacterized protein JCM15063_003070 [Sporobolomyces koalae]|uniref:uncharacterized protein n=1 Tax=Sporobolomyces koalae TaxID=500713 RepID=UPI00317D15F0